MAILIHTMLQLLLLLPACRGSGSSTATATTPSASAWQQASARVAPRNKQGIRLRQSPSANCPNKCSDQSIKFPFGIGPDCFRHPAFAVICDETTSPPRLFLMDGLTEVVNRGIQVSGIIFVRISITISTTPAVDVYNATWKAPASNYRLVSSVMTNLSCDFYTYLIGNPNVNPKIPICTSHCERPGALDAVDDKACYQPETDIYGNTVQFNFVRRNKGQVEQLQNNVEILALGGWMDWNIDDQPSCAAASVDKATFACPSNHNSCVFNPMGFGYRCKCENGYDGNPYTTGPSGCQGLSLPPSLPPYFSVAIGLSVGFGLLLIGLCIMLLIRRWRRDIQKQLRRKYFRKNHGLLLEQLISSNQDASERTQIFSLEELELATNNFDHTRILGRGGHGTVYKGILSDQRVVAIKRSKAIKQGEIDQFINEVAILSRINHRNIVKLYGCCLETEVPLLVYDFVANGSLFEILHSGSGKNYLSWGDGLRIAAEAAGALFYLHSAASISVFHRDVKSSNILLDASYNAKVGDFGTSRLVHIDQTHVSTVVQGTFGYLDPEYCHTGQLSEKSDVYSFGVVLLELLLRRKPIITSDAGSAQNLSSYFLEEMKKRPVKEIVPAQVHEEATEEEILKVASLAEMCLQLRSEGRPTMKTVEMSLQLLHTNRLKQFRDTPEKHRAEAGVESHSGNTTADPISANSHGCYSLEQEFIISASLPR
ncbi:unnamed protein product [Alopecurus aequalis]